MLQKALDKAHGKVLVAVRFLGMTYRTFQHPCPEVRND